MTVYINENSKQLMNIELNNVKKKNKSTYEFKLMELNENKSKIPGPNFDVIVEMKTDDFHIMCKEMSTHGKYMAIICTEKKIEFRCKGNSGVIKKEFENYSEVGKCFIDMDRETGEYKTSGIVEILETEVFEQLLTLDIILINDYQINISRYINKIDNF